MINFSFYNTKIIFYYLHLKAPNPQLLPGDNKNAHCSRCVLRCVCVFVFTAVCARTLDGLNVGVWRDTYPTRRDETEFTRMRQD